ncbi:hypothetical protein GO011_14665 [Mycobacterium sp. 20091114027_K0903767]|nr:hypothetical protein [Mycobacterium sp. 20091114027_K0903767]
MTTDNAIRTSLRSRTLNDYVEDVFLVLYRDDHPDFKALLDACSDEDAVEGSMLADDYLAARMIRDAAPAGSPIKSKKLATIRHALKVVMRRYGVSRRERRELLGGTIDHSGTEE